MISGFAGSFNVIAVNGWMNDPDGLRRRRRRRCVNPRPWEALLNANMWHELIHMYLAGYLVAGFIVAGVYAYAWLKGRRDHYHRTALVVTLAFAVAVRAGAGDRRRLGGAQVAERQPVKLAAHGGPAADARRARRSRSAASTTRRRGEVRYGIEVPQLLSLLAFHDPNATVEGLEIVPPEDRPPVNIVRYRVPDDGRDRHRRSRCSASFFLVIWCAEAAAAALAVVLPGGDGRRAARRSSR